MCDNPKHHAATTSVNGLVYKLNDLAERRQATVDVLWAMEDEGKLLRYQLLAAVKRLNGAAAEA